MARAAQVRVPRCHRVTAARLRGHPRNGVGLEIPLAPLLANQLRSRRCGSADVSWHLDETYVKIAGRWCYLYRAIDGTAKSSTWCSACTATSTQRGAFCGAWSRSPVASRPHSAAGALADNALHVSTDSHRTGVTNHAIRGHNAPMVRRAWMGALAPRPAPL